MRYIKHDNDEWLRKAAEEYPVQPFGMNWEKVATQLDEEGHVTKFREYVFVRYAAMIVFFMLLSLICNKYIRFDFDKRYAAATISLPVNSLNSSDLKPNKREALDNYLIKEQPVDALISKTINKDNYLRDYDGKDEVILRKEKIVSLENKSNAVINSNNNANQIATEQVSIAGAAILLPTDESKQEEFKKEKHKELKLLTRQRLYSGILLGPDMSSVKNQRINDVGYNIGLFIGYRLSKKWQVETGLLWNRKAYYSEGYYFNEGKMYLPQHAEILDVEGYCNMFEIPFNVRYAISSKNKKQWNAVAGLSSYIMTNENYDYRYIRYGNEYKANKVYKNASKDWLSTLNVGLGYELTVGQKLQVRLEPYYKIPLRGIGTGKLPISSTGMNVGVSYPLK